MFFHFLQLRHALQSQFGNSTPDLTSLYLVVVLLGVDSKKLTYLLLQPYTTCSVRLDLWVKE